MSSNSEIRIVKDAPEIFRDAAAEFAELAAECVRVRGRFCVALSGGSTPKGLYALLAREGKTIPWKDIYFFWGDERHVPPDDPESNYRMARETLLSKVPVPPQNVFRVRSEERDADTAAKQYEEALIQFFKLKPGEFPRFDLVLLGLGPEGHTASLFPGSPALAETSRLVMANWVEKLKTNRITFTLPVLNAAAVTIFLVSGEEKAEIVREVLEGNGNPLPAQMIHPENGRLIWLLDEAAASKLSKPSRA